MTEKSTSTNQSNPPYECGVCRSEGFKIPKFFQRMHEKGVYECMHIMTRNGTPGAVSRQPLQAFRVNLRRLQGGSISLVPRKKKEAKLATATAKKAETCVCAALPGTCDKV